MHGDSVFNSKLNANYLYLELRESRAELLQLGKGGLVSLFIIYVIFRLIVWDIERNSRFF